MPCSHAPGDLAMEPGILNRSPCPNVLIFAVKVSWQEPARRPCKQFLCLANQGNVGLNRYNFVFNVLVLISAGESGYCAPVHCPRNVRKLPPAREYIL